MGDSKPTNVTTKHQGGNPVEKHIESVPPAYNPSQIRRPPYKKAAESGHRHPFRLLALPQIH